MLNLFSPEAEAALVQLIDQRVVAQLELIGGNDSTASSPYLTVAEAAEYRRTSPAAIYKSISRGQLRAHRPDGSRILLRRDELDGTGPSGVAVLR